MLIKNIRLFVSSLFLFAFLISTSAFAQDQKTQEQDQKTQDQTDIQQQDEMQQDQRGTKFEDKAIDGLSELNLTDEQRTEVKTVLSEYKNNFSDTNLNDAQKFSYQEQADQRIAQILDENQLAQYNTIKQNWWNNVNANVASDMEETETEDKTY